MEKRDATEPHYIEVTSDSEEKKRTFLGMGTGFVTGLLGWFGVDAVVGAKLIPFDAEVAKRTRQDIISRGGLGAGIAESGAFSAGASSHIIEQAHAFELMQQPEFKLAKRLQQMGGRGMPGIIGGVVAGLGAAGAYFALAPKKEPKVERVMLPQECRPSTNEADAGQKGTKNWKESLAKEHAEKESAHNHGVSA